MLLVLILALALVLVVAGATAAESTGQGSCPAALSARVVIGCWQILERHADEGTAVSTLSAYGCPRPAIALPASCHPTRSYNTTLARTHARAAPHAHAHRYAQAGFKTYDTADIYGRSESVLGQLRGLGVQPVIHTKFVTSKSDEETARQVIYAHG